MAHMLCDLILDRSEFETEADYGKACQNKLSSIMGLCTDVCGEGNFATTACATTRPLISELPGGEAHPLSVVTCQHLGAADTAKYTPDVLKLAKTPGFCSEENQIALADKIKLAESKALELQQALAGATGGMDAGAAISGMMDEKVNKKLEDDLQARLK